MFEAKFDENQQMLHCMAGQDDLICGILSKQKGQILRMAAVLNCLFFIEDLQGEPHQELSIQSVTAAIDFVEVCCQQSCIIAGRKIAETVGEVILGVF